MNPVTLDVVLLLPAHLRQKAVECSELLAKRMAEQGSLSRFQLGKPYHGGSTDHCEPHVSLFMLSVDETEVHRVTQTIGHLATKLPTLSVDGHEYRHNPYGAPELYFRKTPQWRNVQRAIISNVEPLRRGRLRDTDPSGARIRDVIENLSEEDPQRHQLLKYGYDEIAEDSTGDQDRFNPHITLAWPRDPDRRVSFDGLPLPQVFSGHLTGLAVFGMSAYGTCTKSYGSFRLV
ncbi:MAG: hypothetical protein DLM55_09025 [Acidimicrobiales bacterium]|nr:MAG: hypothetical protein DLM55_09025 [Acidimicrobiales bacterium]